MENLKISFFHRKRDNFMWSIEKLFADLRRQLLSQFDHIVYEAPCASQGFWFRLKNIRWACRHQGTINHITGDIHYIALGLPGKNTILTIHDLGFMQQYKGIYRWLLWLFWIYLPVRRVKWVVAISEATKKEILRYSHCSPEKIKVIPNFISPNIVAAQKEFNPIQPVILQMGTKFNKNLERLVVALKGIN